MRYFRWSQSGSVDKLSESASWYIEKILFKDIDHWYLKSGQVVETWDENTTAFVSHEANYVDFPFVAFDIPIYSSKLKMVMETFSLANIQYLPLKIVNKNNNDVVHGFCIANYLDVIDCLDRGLSSYEIWTKETLLYWEDRPWMLGTFHDVKRLVLDISKIGNSPLFRLQGWEVAVIIREDVKQAIEQANISGCMFSELETLR